MIYYYLWFIAIPATITLIWFLIKKNIGSVKKLRQQRVYTEPSLTLAETADMLSIPVYQLSQAINRCYDCNFLTLINRKRVEEMKNRLLETGNSVLEIGMDAGFNSKSTINLAFKKETGMTPSQYRKENTPEAG